MKLKIETDQKLKKSDQKESKNEKKTRNEKTTAQKAQAGNTKEQSVLKNEKKSFKSKISDKAVSQFRQDPVTGDWVIIATGRAKRPEQFISKKKKEELKVDKADCPFDGDNLKKQRPDTLVYYRENGEWSLKVFPNLYPAVTRSKDLKHSQQGMYFLMDGVGYHEVIVTKDHDRGVPFLIKEEVAEVLDAFKTRYLELMNRKSVSYILFIENHGKESGASLIHPHWQMFAIPFVSSAIKLELEGSRIYKNNNDNCVYCDMIKQEIKDKKRIVASSDNFIAFTPFASRSAFEVWILPKKHQPYFERMTENDEFEAASVLKKVIEKYYWNLNDVSYNMYIHTSPCDGRDYSYYHWHIELLPKTAVWAGFELGTGIEISTIEPEKAAEFLRKKNN
ncbi:MAG: galactose-1-phosphate uridylyltransferase [Candidatus Moranbacteria bacterium]|nr:galactose-1-phosphate uridylyltransferase [Candidatus Moranbacteria bacterium]